VLQHVEFKRENSVRNSIDEVQRSRAMHQAAVRQFHTDFALLCKTAVQCLKQLFGALHAI